MQEHRKRTVALLAGATTLWVGGCAMSLHEPTPAGDRNQERTDTQQTIAAEYDTEDGFRISPEVTSASGGTRVGFMIDLDAGAPGDATLALEARGVAEDGTAGTWVPAAVTFAEHPYRVAVADLPEWAASVQVRLPDEDLAVVDSLTFEAIVPADDGNGTLDLDEQADAEQGLSAALADLGVNARAAWGARPSKCTGGDSAKYRMAVHHTVTGTTLNGSYPARLRQIQAYHMDARNWCDVGYHFLITADGRAWEARPVHRRGAHVGLQNSGNIGVSFVGCFDGSCGGNSQPTTAMIDRGASLIAGLGQIYGIGMNQVRGHRDHAGAQTACPGSNLYARLGDLKSGTPAPGGGGGLNADIVVVKRTGTGSDMTEAHVLSRADGYASFSTQVGTALHKTGGAAWQFGAGDYDGDGVRDLFAINRAGGSGQTEVHVLEGADGFQSFLTHSATALHPTDNDNWTMLVGDHDGDGRDDVIAVNRAGGTDKTEVHVLRAADNFQSFSLHKATPLHVTNTPNWSFVAGDVDADGRADVYAINRHGGSDQTEVHVLGGASGYNDFVMHAASDLHPTDAGEEHYSFTAADANGDGRDDVVLIKRAGGSGQTEVHVLNAADSFATVVLHAATALGATTANNAYTFVSGS